MKRFVSIALSAAIIASLFCFRSFANAETTLVLQVDNPIMTVNGEDKEVDAGIGTTPVIQNNRTLVPIRAIIEAMGGSVEWDSDTRTSTLKYNDNEIKLVIDSTTAEFNGEEVELDTAPVIVNGRTLLPIRFIAESFGFNTDWDTDTRSITISNQNSSTEAVTETTEISTESETVAADTTVSTDKNTNSKILIAYFSRAENINLDDDVDAVSSASLNDIDGNVDGNTKIVAEMIQSEIGGDIFSIQSEDLYPTDYQENVSLAQDEKSNSDRPALKDHINNFDEYDTIFIGYPIWWSTAPMPVYTFLEEYDFSGKTVIPFSTHKGSGMGSSARDIKDLLTDSNVLDGFTIEGDDAVNSLEEVKEELSNLDIK